MAENTADQSNTEAAKPNAGGESPQAPAQPPRVDPIAETKLLEEYYRFINRRVRRRAMNPALFARGERIDLGIRAPGAGPFLW